MPRRVVERHAPCSASPPRRARRREDEATSTARIASSWAAHAAVADAIDRAAEFAILSIASVRCRRRRRADRPSPIAAGLGGARIAGASPRCRVEPGCRDVVSVRVCPSLCAVLIVAPPRAHLRPVAVPAVHRACASVAFAAPSAWRGTPELTAAAVRDREVRATFARAARCRSYATDRRRLVARTISPLLAASLAATWSAARSRARVEVAAARRTRRSSTPGRRSREQPQLELAVVAGRRARCPARRRRLDEYWRSRETRWFCRLRAREQRRRSRC